MGGLIGRTLVALFIAPAVGVIVLHLSFVAISVVDLVTAVADPTADQILDSVFGSVPQLVLMVGLCAAYVVALPIALITNAVFRRVGWRKGWHYAAAGGAIGFALFAAFLLLLSGWQIVLILLYGPMGALAGASAAATYWRLAVKPTSDRAAQPPKEPSPAPRF